MISIRVTYEDGNTTLTGFNGTIEDARRYYVGQSFNFGDTDEHPADRMVKCTGVDLIPNVSRERWTEPCNERYDFDFKRCHFRDGWAQIDTKQDASYYGNWANPLQLRIVSFVEGDVTVTTASSPEDFAAELRAMKKWHDEAGYGMNIDGMCSGAIIDAFKQMNLGDLLH